MPLLPFAIVAGESQEELVRYAFTYCSCAERLLYWVGLYKKDLPMTKRTELMSVLLAVQTGKRPDVRLKFSRQHPSSSHHPACEKLPCPNP